MNSFLSYLDHRSSWGHVKWHHKPFLTVITEYRELNRKIHKWKNEKTYSQGQERGHGAKGWCSEAVLVWLPQPHRRAGPCSPPLLSAWPSGWTGEASGWSQCQHWPQVFPALPRSPSLSPWELLPPCLLLFHLSPSAASPSTQPLAVISQHANRQQLPPPSRNPNHCVLRFKHHSPPTCVSMGFFSTSLVCSLTVLSASSSLHLPSHLMTVLDDNSPASQEG